MLKTINKKGHLHYDENAIYDISSCYFVFDEKNAPRLLSLHLSELLTEFCYFSLKLIRAITLQSDINSFLEKDPSERMDLVMKKLNALLDSASVLPRQMNDFSKGQEQTLMLLKQSKQKQKEIIDNQDDLKKLTINRNEIEEEKTGILSIEQCVLLIGLIKKHYYELRIDDCKKIGLPPDTVKKLPEKTIRRYVEYWDQYLRTNKKQGRKPPRKDYSRNMSQEDYSKLINAVELDKYNKWRARNRIAELSKVHGHPGQSYKD